MEEIWKYKAKSDLKLFINKYEFETSSNCLDLSIHSFLFLSNDKYIKSIKPLYSTSNFLTKGNSIKQGLHHVAQQSTTTGLFPNKVLKKLTVFSMLIILLFMGIE